MADEKPKTLESETHAVAHDAVLVLPPPPPAPAPAPEVDTKALVIVDKTPDLVENKSSKGSLDRDIALGGLEKEKKLSFIKAWEENEKSKAENNNLVKLLKRAQKNLSAVDTWENTKKANIESKLKKIEEDLERKKAEYAEKMKNQVALIHKQAEEKRAMVEARRGEDILKAEEMAAKHRATGTTPKKLLGCF